MLVVAFALLYQVTALAQQEAETELVELVQEGDEKKQEDKNDGDAEAAPAAAVGVAFQGFSKARMHAAKKFQIKQKYAVHIELLKRVCQLDKKQALKLTIAAKGQAARQSDKWIKKYGVQMQGMFGQNPKGKKKKEEEVVIKDADDIDEQTLQFLTNGFGSPFSTAKGPTQKPEWVQTLTKVLTIEQLEKYKKHLEHSAAQYRKVQLDYAINVVSRSVNLTDEQSVKIAALLKPQIAKMNEPENALYAPYLLFYRLVKIDQKKVKEILTPAQTQRWKLLIGPYRQIGEMMEQEEKAAEEADAVEPPAAGKENKADADKADKVESKDKGI